MMTNTRGTIFALVVSVAPAFCQQAPDPPVKNWAAPLLWTDGSAARRRAVERDTRSAASQPVGPAAFSNAFTAGLVFVAMPPCRLLDTRADQNPGFPGFDGPYGPPALAGGVPRLIPLPFNARCLIPGAAQAYSLNFTVLPAKILLFLNAWAAGSAFPGTSILNAPHGGFVANSSIVKAGVNGAIQVLASDPTDLIIDINGFYVEPRYEPLTGSLSAPALTFWDENAGFFSTGPGNISAGSYGSTLMSLSPTATAFPQVPNSGVTGATVVVTPGGQLGVSLSSRRYKEDIHDIGDLEDDLMRLRPVAFRYKNASEDGTKPLQFGLIAEEVAEVFPDLVFRGKDGDVETVQYQQLGILVLNEMQKQQNTIAAQQRLIESQAVQLRDQAARLAALESIMRR